MEQLNPTEQNEQYEALYQQIISGSLRGKVLTDSEGFSKADFLRFLSEKGTVLFHGTNAAGIEALEPRQANCGAKEFGNKCAVYATEDPVLPMFHAVFNKQHFSGRSHSGVTESSEGLKYNFAIQGTFHAGQMWTRGYVYLLDKADFVQGTDDEGQPIDEYVSIVPVIPLAQMVLDPEEFPYIEEVEVV